MTKSTPQLCKDGFVIQDGSSRVVSRMTILLVMLMKFSGQIQLGDEIMYSMFTVVFSVQYCQFFSDYVFMFVVVVIYCNCNLYWIQYFTFVCLLS